MSNIKVCALKIVKETTNATLIRVGPPRYTEQREVWIPTSLIDAITRYPDGRADLMVAEWKAEQEDL